MVKVNHSLHSTALFLLSLACLLLVPSHIAPKPAAEYAFVISNAGLTLRVRPDRTAEAILVMPYDARVEFVERDLHDEVDGFSSNWLRVRYRDREGFAFGAYLARHSPTNNADLNSLKKRGIAGTTRSLSRSFAVLVSETSCILYGGLGDFRAESGAGMAGCQYLSLEESQRALTIYVAFTKCTVFADSTEPGIPPCAQRIAAKYACAFTEDLAKDVLIERLVDYKIACKVAASRICLADERPCTAW